MAGILRWVELEVDVLLTIRSNARRFKLKRLSGSRSVLSSSGSVSNSPSSSCISPSSSSWTRSSSSSPSVVFSSKYSTLSLLTSLRGFSWHCSYPSWLDSDWLESCGDSIDGREDLPLTRDMMTRESDLEWWRTESLSRSTNQQMRQRPEAPAVVPSPSQCIEFPDSLPQSLSPKALNPLQQSPCSNDHWNRQFFIRH